MVASRVTASVVLKPIQQGQGICSLVTWCLVVWLYTCKSLSMARKKLSCRLVGQGYCGTKLTSHWASLGIRHSSHAQLVPESGAGNWRHSASWKQIRGTSATLQCVDVHPSLCTVVTTHVSHMQVVILYDIYIYIHMYIYIYTYIHIYTYIYI